MKKSLIIICMMMGMTPVFAQNKAVNKADKLLQQVRTPEATDSLSKLSEAKTNIDAAIQDEKTKDKARTWYTRGQIYGVIAQANNPNINALAPNALEEAVSSFQKAMALEEGKPNATYYVLAEQQGINPLWQSFIESGAAAYDAGNFETALQGFEKALVVKPTDTVASLYAGIAADQLGEKEKSVDYFYKLIEAGSQNKQIYHLLVSYERDQKENYDKAAYVIKKAKEVFPTDSEFNKHEVQLLIKQGKSADAIAELKKAIAAEPQNPDLHFSLGTLHDELKETDAAIEAYKAALAVDPAHKNSAYNLAVIHFNRANDLANEAKNVGLSKEETKRGAELKKQAEQFFKEAVPYVEEALRLHPDNTQMMEVAVVTYYNAGMTEKGKELDKKLEAMGQ